VKINERMSNITIKDLNEKIKNDNEKLENRNEINIPILLIICLIVNLYLFYYIGGSNMNSNIKLIVLYILLFVLLIIDNIGERLKIISIIIFNIITSRLIYEVLRDGGKLEEKEMRIIYIIILIIYTIGITIRNIIEIIKINRNNEIEKDRIDKNLILGLILNTLILIIIWIEKNKKIIS
jgi:hypothetical protein